MFINYSSILMPNMKKKHLLMISLLVIFLITVGIRLFYAFGTSTFSDDSAYFTLRQIEHIKDTGHPLYYDPLSYGGRTHVFLPLFHYILAFFSLFFGTIAVAKAVPNIVASTLVFVVYLIISRITRNKWVAVLTAFISAFIPIYISETINSISVYSFTIPLSFLMLYFLLSRKFNLFLASLILFMLLSPSVVLIVMTMILYFVFSWVEGFTPHRAEIELTVFSVFLVTWFYFLVYRDAFLLYGYRIIWYNIPKEVLAKYFSQFDMPTALYQIGIIPILSGIYMFYHYMFKKKKKSVYMLISLLVIVGLLLLLKFIQLRMGMMYIGVALAILFGEFFILLMSYISRTKFAGYRNWIVAGFIAIFIATSFLPSLGYANEKMSESVSEEKVFAFTFLGNISEENAAFVGSVFEGNLINYYIKRKNIIDTDFLMIRNVDARLRDVRTIYTSAIETKPVEIMKKYNADYIIFTDAEKRYYNITRIAYVDEDCFPLVYSGKDVKVYKRKCWTD